jgi:hypothetical protein
MAAIVAALVLFGPAALVAAVGLLLLCLLPVGVIVAARLQPSPMLKDFGGRYTYSGPLLGWLKQTPQREAPSDCLPFGATAPLDASTCATRHTLEVRP